MPDRRVFERMKTKLPVKFLDPSTGKEGEANTFDVSADGLGLLTYENLPEQTSLELWLNIPGRHTPFYTRGEVRWYKGRLDNCVKRVGVHLESAELMDLIRALSLKERAQILSRGRKTLTHL